MPIGFTTLAIGHRPLEEYPGKYVVGTLRPSESAQSHWPSGEYFGDGSGGSYGQFDSLRRCGVGIVCLNGFELKFGFYYRLPGSVQTVPRAEASALRCVLFMAGYGTTIIYYTDCEPVYSTFNKRKSRACKVIMEIFLKIYFNL